jgi:hypothetical protein
MPEAIPKEQCEHEYLNILEEYEQGLSMFFVCECSTCKKIIEVENN